ncbi:hypothetical protein HELRODRAFT_97508 [Helobdella robusta]|uniref:RNA helicase n=1 Tax=Helobdella robusta TaxID=6412 RepID=T1G9H5_HELRO|nr:hypothetical protein HELRODRAFT_97508 [Helobdella robusta]ESO09339.1 hypothetical protein HELRODRAFT_97508 [Helobdella robusta]
MLKVLNEFYARPAVRELADECGLDGNLFHKAYVGFRRFCMESERLPTDLHIVISDIVRKSGHVDDIFPYFLRHGKTMYPHLDCMEDLKKISDLRQPANWYPEARSKQRKIIYHAGPTNSGKTYHALERFMSASSGVYCGPLRMLATEIFKKTNAAGHQCDLVTGEERRYMSEGGEPSSHVACTVEMTNIAVKYEVAVIDEIQMVRDLQRGWAWTRAFLGTCADEVHVCGEESGINLIKELSVVTGDVFEVRRYKRLTNLKIASRGVDNFDRVKPGDCIVCFGKNDIYNVSKQLEKRGVEVAVIYGTLPPGTKIAQAEKFNDPNNRCKVMVATDAIGMGLNLNIKRVVFYSLMKPSLNSDGEKEIDIIPTTTALQIAGRAGRFSTEFSEGEVTTFKSQDLPILKRLLNSAVEPIQQAGLHPTAEQIELFAFHLPKATLSNLIDIFVKLCQVDNDKYFMCNVDDFKFLADMIEHVPLDLRTRYVFCCAPIPKKQPFVCSVFLKFARQFSKGMGLTMEWLCRQVGWPFRPPQTIMDLVHLEGVFDVLDLYLWLSYRFPNMFPDVEQVRDMQKELDQVIQAGIVNIVRLLEGTESSVADNEDEFEIASKINRRSSSKTNFPISTLLSEQEQDSTINQLPQSLSSRFQNAKAEKSEFDKKLASALKNLSAKPGQKISDQLIKYGLLNKNILDKLQEELKSQYTDKNNDCATKFDNNNINKGNKSGNNKGG